MAMMHTKNGRYLHCNLQIAASLLEYTGIMKRRDRIKLMQVIGNLNFNISDDAARIVPHDDKVGSHIASQRVLMAETQVVRQRGHTRCIVQR